jgi:hypothetical protein
VPQLEAPVFGERQHAAGAAQARRRQEVSERGVDAGEGRVEPLLRDEAKALLERPLEEQSARLAPVPVEQSEESRASFLQSHVRAAVRLRAPGFEVRPDASAQQHIHPGRGGK